MDCFIRTRRRFGRLGGRNRIVGPRSAGRIVAVRKIQRGVVGIFPAITDEMKHNMVHQHGDLVDKIKLLLETPWTRDCPRGPRRGEPACFVTPATLLREP